MGLCESCCKYCPCCPHSVRHPTILSKSLRTAQARTRTVTGKLVNQTVYNEFHSMNQLNQFKIVHRMKSSLFSDLYTKPYNDFTKITDNLYLTGMGGICKENIEAYRIKSIINSTFELPKYVVKDIESLRIPVSILFLSK